MVYGHDLTIEEKILKAHKHFATLTYIFSNFVIFSNVIIICHFAGNWQSEENNKKLVEKHKPSLQIIHFLWSIINLNLTKN